MLPARVPLDLPDDAAIHVLFFGLCRLAPALALAMKRLVGFWDGRVFPLALVDIV